METYNSVAQFGQSNLGNSGCSQLPGKTLLVYLNEALEDQNLSTKLSVLIHKQYLKQSAGCSRIRVIHTVSR